MNKLSFAALAASLVVGGAGAAYAGNQVISISGSGDYEPYYLFPYVPEGTYILNFTSTVPIASGDFMNVYRYIFNEYDEDGSYLGGDEDDVVQDYEFPVGVTNFIEILDIVPLPSDYTIYYPDGAREEQGFYDGYYSEFYASYDESGPAGAYTFTVTSIPEPYTWALMLVGLGGVGGMMRRARGSAVATTADRPNQGSYSA